MAARPNRGRRRSSIRDAVRSLSADRRAPGRANLRLIVVTDLRARDVGYGPASNGNGFSLYLTHPQQIVEIGGLGTWDFDQGPRIDDDHDGYCENGSDQNADGDCLDPGEDTADRDRDDADPALAPGVVELCDALDNDCDMAPGSPCAACSRWPAAAIDCEGRPTQPPATIRYFRAGTSSNSSAVSAARASGLPWYAAGVFWKRAI